MDGWMDGQADGQTDGRAEVSDTLTLVPSFAMLYVHT